MSLETLVEKKWFKTIEQKQKTLAKSVTFSGNGLFTGAQVEVTITPAKAGSGVSFQRIDIDGAPIISATTDNLFATPRCTILGNDLFQIVCVEHLLSALSGCGIDNALISLNGGEIPIFDGSALPFVEFFEGAGVVEQEETFLEYHLQEPLFLCDRDMQIIALPSKSLKYSYTLSYPGHPLLGGQFAQFDPTIDSYKESIAPARTFSPKQEVETLIAQGLLKSASLDHGVILDGAKVMNPEGLRFDNEMARHKVLDTIGDLALTGKKVVASFIGIKSGHALNTAFAKLLREKMELNS
ncbi:UDP-3-O-acyl-N-acetylglucosamine deacetylase [bacterium]|nr:UDP-3-O-acyl-N-acetylglucosamine deacetylase [bacterium]